MSAFDVDEMLERLRRRRQSDGEWLIEQAKAFGPDVLAGEQVDRWGELLDVEKHAFETDVSRRARMLQRLRCGGCGTREDLQAAVSEMAYSRIPAGVHCAGLVLSARGGWRAAVLRVCMWVIRKTGHEVMLP